MISPDPEGWGATYGNLYDPIRVVIETSHLAVYPNEGPIVVSQTLVSRHVSKPSERKIFSNFAVRN